MDKQISEAAAAMGRKGGKAKLKKYGKKHYSEMGKKGMETRWGKKKDDQKKSETEEDELDKEEE